MDEYYELTSNLDAREILRYLNSLGINNISGEVLKYFITDLKKLIKHDLENKKEEDQTKPEILGLERLHSASTFSSRIRSKAQGEAVMKCSREFPDKKRCIRNIHSAPNLGEHQKTDDKTLRRACSCIRVERNTDGLRESKSSSNNNNLIKVPKSKPVKKCDPVSLYHYYSRMWDKYKPNVPGENNWADLRWSVRQKMVGSVATNKPTSHWDLQSRTKGKEK